MTSISNRLNNQQDGNRRPGNESSEYYLNIHNIKHFGLDLDPNDKVPVKLEVLENLGEGSQAVVEKVEVVSNSCSMENLKCARKLWTGKTGVQISEEEFSREIKILKKFSEARHFITLLATYSHGIELGLLHLPVAQCDLSELLAKSVQERRELMPDDDLERAFGCLSAALYYLNQESIRHRDIKPHNILVYNGTLVFTDFGYSNDFSGKITSLTDGDRPVGTRDWNAPEVEARRPRGCSTDVFSLGCVLLEIWSVLSGRSPGDRDSFTCMRPYHEKLKEIHTWIGRKKSSGLPAARIFWLEACQFMLAKEARKRPRMTNVLIRFGEERAQDPASFSTMCCQECLQNHILPLTEGQFDEVRNTDFTWNLDVSTLPKDDNIEIQPNAKRVEMYGNINGLMDTLLCYFGFRKVERWDLIIFFEDEGYIKSYGTRPADVNYSFGFKIDDENRMPKDRFVSRVIFSRGTFANEVELYKEHNWGNLAFRNKSCNHHFSVPVRVRSYKIFMA